MADTDFEQVYGTFASGLARYFADRARPDEVDDLLQDCFQRIATGLPDVRDVDKLSGWIRTVARNTLTDHYRRNRKQFPPELLVPDERLAGEDESLNATVAGWLRDCADALPARYRDALVWADFDGIPQKDIAKRLGLSLSGAKSRVQRGRARLREELLRCCHIDSDRYGNVLDVTPRSRCGC